MGHPRGRIHCPIMSHTKSDPDPGPRLTTVAVLAWGVAQRAERHTQWSPPSCSRNGLSALVTKKELPWSSPNRQITPPPRKPGQSLWPHGARRPPVGRRVLHPLAPHRSYRADTLPALNEQSSSPAQPTRRPSQTVDSARVPLVTRSDDSVDYNDNDGRPCRQ